MSNKNYSSVEEIRNSIAHVFAYAVSELYKPCKLICYHTTSSGFFYEIDSTNTISKDDLPEIEKKMTEILEKNIPIEKLVVSASEAIKIFQEKGEVYKATSLNNISGSNNVSICKIGNFVDLSDGACVSNTSEINPNAFRLISVSGINCLEDPSKTSLQRIYGVAFLSEGELDDYIKNFEEAERRDHRKLGKSLHLFHLDEVSPGSVFWLPKGLIVINLIKDLVSKITQKYGYQQIQTPLILSKSLWETSGHWDKFHDNMFIIRDDEKQEMAIKPMSCPGHIIVYKSGAVKSYRDLPLRYSEFGICHRKESTGSLQGIMRLLSFTQDDGHIFCTPDQIVEETQNFCQSLKEAYSVFGFNDISVKLSTRPKVRVGTDEVWDLAEKSLSEAAMASNIEFSICEGEGAFYGPKLEFVLKDAMKRDWQCGTLQVDFILPERFNATYIDKNGDKKCPVLIHRAIFGSLERFVGILIENYSGFFPFWISPVQISICSVSEVAEDYALKVFKILTESGYRCTLDVKNEKITYKIREHSSQKVPFIIILGKSELENSTVTVRKFNTCENESVNLNSISEYFHNIGYK